ncbi:uncharacterized protein LTR77_009569 [Saxophila tyrrhenica]|uniref:Uncharacterized protein n=1 Tax=Saxophila tyrrhenica TaxID=1690608 RepID=A0AAV9P246_9PEZI|nr:hypothetical protein LTR77_009569 [Saxophila tyrrhenica]
MATLTTQPSALTTPPQSPHPWQAYLARPPVIWAHVRPEYDVQSEGVRLKGWQVGMMKPHRLTYWYGSEYRLSFVTKPLQPGQLEVDLYKRNLGLNMDAEGNLIPVDQKEVPWRLFLGFEYRGHEQRYIHITFFTHPRTW